MKSNGSLRTAQALESSLASLEKIIGHLLASLEGWERQKVAEVNSKKPSVGGEKHSGDDNDEKS
jgi:hypothetical protein